jgi:hypothetical protein
MPLQIAGVMKDPHDIDPRFAAAAIDEEMPRLPDNAQVAASPIAAEGQVVGADAARQIRPLFGPWPLRIGSDVAQSLF